MRGRWIAFFKIFNVAVLLLSAPVVVGLASSAVHDVRNRCGADERAVLEQFRPSFREESPYRGSAANPLVRNGACTYRFVISADLGEIPSYFEEIHAYYRERLLAHGWEIHEATDELGGEVGGVRGDYVYSAQYFVLDGDSPPQASFILEVSIARRVGRPDYRK